MKKKLLKIFMLIFGCGLFLTGCATVSNVTDQQGKNVYYETPQYFQGQVAKVGNYLYYGNAYADIASSDFNYATASLTTYLARVDIDNMAFDEDVLLANKAQTSPKNVEKVNGAKVAGYVNQDMYALGGHLYFTSANIHQSSSLKNDYTRVSLFRVAFNGDGLQELGTFTNDENSTITLQQGSDGKYYFVIVCPTEKTGEESETTTYDIYSIRVGDSVGGLQQLATKVNSAVVADENSQEKTVVYSYGTESERLPNAVSAVDYATGDVTNLDSGNVEAISLLGREGDIAFYAYKGEVYYKDLVVGGTFTPASNQLFYSAASISKIDSMGTGYVFVGTSALMYKSSFAATAVKLAATDAYSDILFVDGDYVYLSNDSSIMKVSKFGGEVETIVKDMTIISGQCGYADEYIYFYAQLGDLVDEDGETVDRETADDNYYLYQTDKSGNIQLVGKTK